MTSATLVAADAQGIERAARALESGRLIGFPTETVYGLGALARDDKAVARLYLLKGRPQANPLIVHIAERSRAAIFAHFDERADALARAFWPGPMTLVLPLKVYAPISRLVTAALSTVAIRVPRHPIARALLERVDLPVAAPSANRSGRVSPTRAETVMRELGHGLELVLDGGSCEIGVESTVLDLSDARTVRILRPGGLPRAAIESVLGPLDGATNETLVRSPGRLGRHYAPHRPLRTNAERVERNEALLAFGPHVLDGCRHIRNLSERGDLMEAASNLFSMLRELDETDAAAIAVMPIPREGLGEAINDRLARASISSAAEP